MAVKSKSNGKELILQIDNGDLSELNEAMEKFKFKDHQGFLRFAVSSMLVTESNSIFIKKDGVAQEIRPSEELLTGE